LFASNVQLLLLFSTALAGCKVFGRTHIWWCGLVCKGALIDNDQGVGHEKRIRARNIKQRRGLQQVGNE
jgi:hypothetical protein